MKAQKVLNDCKECYWDLKDALSKNDQQLIRIKWITCLAFLRIVGHVLEKVDKAKHPEQHHVFDEIFQKKRTDHIFKNFIEKERNLAIKEYEIFIEPDKFGVETEVGMLTEDGSRILTQSGEYLVLGKTERINHFSRRSSDLGKDVRLDNLVEEAINWWETYLTEVNSKLNAT